MMFLACPCWKCINLKNVNRFACSVPDVFESSNDIVHLSSTVCPMQNFRQVERLQWSRILLVQVVHEPSKIHNDVCFAENSHNDDVVFSCCRQTVFRMLSMPMHIVLPMAFAGCGKLFNSEMNARSLIHSICRMTWSWGFVKRLLCQFFCRPSLCKNSTKCAI